MSLKYEITDIAHPKYPWLHRIRALRDVRKSVHAGDLGGYVQCEENLSQMSGCWIFGEAIVCEGAHVALDGTVSGTAIAKGCSLVSGDGFLTGHAQLMDSGIVVGGVVREFAVVAGHGTIRKNMESGVAPDISHNVCIYGIVSGNVKLEENVTVLPGVSLENPTPDLMVIGINVSYAEQKITRMQICPPPDYANLLPIKKKHRHEPER